MRVLGHLDFGGLGGKLKRAVFAEELNGLPLDGKPGEFCFFEKKIFVCVSLEDDLPFWVQLTQEINTYRHDQTVAALEWTVQHNFNENAPTVMVYDSTGKAVMPDEIDGSDPDRVIVKFNTPTAGIAKVMDGSSVGLPKSNVAFTDDFTNVAVWVVNHNLGFNPSITCIIDGYVVQPNSIVHNSTMQATVTFSSSRTGSVRCV